MNIMEQTRNLCRLYDIRPARSKGQNFLINEDVYNQIVEASAIKKNDVILEVGPGLGFLTALLSKKAETVIAVELDDKLASVLKTGLDSQDINNVEVINENILDFSTTKHPDLSQKKYKIVANLPYNITSVFLRKFLSGDNKPESMVLMLQKEVAERIVARPGEMSLLAVSVQFYADTEIVQIVKSSDFWPAPDVDSAIVNLKIKTKKQSVDEKNFFRLVKIGFSARRKMLKNNLANGYHIKQEMAEGIIKKAGFSEKIRAQELSLNDWLALFPYFEKN